MPSRPPASRPPIAPNEANLHDAALRYLARYSATQASLLKVLTRRIERWAAAAAADAAEIAQAQRAARIIVSRLVKAGAVDDALFAAGRARSLHRAGRSRRAITAHLQAKGVPADLAVLPDDPEAELAAALLYLSRRRIGPFRHPRDPAARPKDLARLARAGFSAAIARRALDLPVAEAEDLLLQARRG